MPPDLVLLSTLTGLNYLCLELIFMVLKVFDPLKFDCLIFYLSLLFKSCYLKLLVFESNFSGTIKFTRRDPIWQKIYRVDDISFFSKDLNNTYKDKPTQKNENTSHLRKLYGMTLVGRQLSISRKLKYISRVKHHEVHYSNN